MAVLPAAEALVGGLWLTTGTKELTKGLKTL